MLLELRYVTATNGTANFDPEEHPPDKGWKDDFDMWLWLKIINLQNYEEEAIGIHQPWDARKIHAR